MRTSLYPLDPPCDDRFPKQITPVFRASRAFPAESPPPPYADRQSLKPAPAPDCRAASLLVVMGWECRPLSEDGVCAGGRHPFHAQKSNRSRSEEHTSELQ